MADVVRLAQPINNLRISDGILERTAESLRERLAARSSVPNFDKPANNTAEATIEYQIPGSWSNHAASVSPAAPRLLQRKYTGTPVRIITSPGHVAVV